MTELNDIYNLRLLELAASIPNTGHLSNPDALGEAHSKLCGSTISVEVSIEKNRVTNFAQNVKACLLGQATASIVGREIIGSSLEEIQSVGDLMRKMLKESGPPPTGRWSDLALLGPVRDYQHRQASALLVFEALDRAIKNYKLQEEEKSHTPTTQSLD